MAIVTMKHLRLVGLEGEREALLRALQGRLATAQQKVDVLMGQLEPEVSDEQRDTTLS